MTAFDRDARDRPQSQLHFPLAGSCSLSDRPFVQHFYSFHRQAASTRWQKREEYWQIGISWRENSPTLSDSLKNGFFGYVSSRLRISRERRRLIIDADMEEAVDRLITSSGISRQGVSDQAVAGRTAFPLAFLLHTRFCIDHGASARVPASLRHRQRSRA